MNEGEGPKLAGPRTNGRQSDAANILAAVLVFVLGVVTGFPLATTGVQFLTENLGQVLTVLLVLLLVALVIATLLFIFRKQIWGSLFRRGEIEMERFAQPLADVARYAATQKVDEATDAARSLAELVLARYAWIATRRWLVATMTAFIAAIAALAGSALLFQQNQLLREQTERLSEQNRMIEYQIELGDADRSAAILPEILDIGAELGNEANSIDPMADGSLSTNALSASLQARIVAASNAARPYRYLQSPILQLDDEQISVSALLRRRDLPVAERVASQLRAAGIEPEAITELGAGELIDRPVSPERGQLLTLLFQSRFFDTEWLTSVGADFSYAEVRAPILVLMSLRHANLRFADFSRISLNQVQFGGAVLEQARFVRTELKSVSFAALTNSQAHQTYQAPDSETLWVTRMSGADFRRARIEASSFAGAAGFAINFDGALLHEVDFSGASIAGSTFRGATFGAVDFSGANMASVDFQDAVVFDPGFLETLGSQAEAGSFDPGAYRLEPVPDSQRAELPLQTEHFRMGELADAPAFRIVSFDQP
ncbi:MAG: pentapeptide repeat-containing protein [Devosia sp.]|uniref:pentapeptide repeat-containing protein n=1 Tax=Devosia sp. TaxID=1871048 RepID=UPI0024CA92CD|nr:pentapeptide repeat-containing protein [Devosia sp.]UYO00806.1 MAG: pentapeptide repeat-containing protein [Devosia sp.]